MYPGNHTDSEILSVPRNLKTRPGAPETHLAYITDDEADLLEIYKPDTPHRGPHDVPNYDSFAWDASGAVTESGSGADWSEGTGWSNTGGSSGSGGFGGDVGGPRPDTYQAPHEVYGPGIAEGGETVYNYTSLNPDNAAHQGVLSTINNMWQTDSGKRTLKFFGWNPNNPYSVPAEFINSIAQGSVVSGNEIAVNDAKAPIITPNMTEEAKQAAKVQAMRNGWDPWIGTWGEVEGQWNFGDPGGLLEGAMTPENYSNYMESIKDFELDPALSHPMFPGGVSDFYAATSDPFVVPYTGGRGGSGGGGRGWGSGGGGGGGRGGGMGGGGPRFQGDFAGEGPWGQSHIQRKWIEQLRNPHGEGYFRGYNRGGIVSLC